MKKIVLVPDSFKGSMNSREVCAVMERQIRLYLPGVVFVSTPVADGGEGTVDSFLTAVGGERIHLRVQGPYGREIEGFYGIIDQGKTAVIEMAAAAGLPLAGKELRVERASTYGVGQLIRDAAGRGVKKIIVGLGGSCTNDFGAGAAAACGIRFLRRDGTDFIPTGATLGEVDRIDRSGLLPHLQEIEIAAICDIENPLYGSDGAAYVFAPQKGADAAMVKFLDKQLRAIDFVTRRDLGLDVSALPGAGAAGGMGGGMAAFFGAKLQKGIDVVLETVNFSEKLEHADLVFTGEGRIDSQSLCGKVVSGVARYTKERGIPLIAVVGSAEDGIDVAAYDLGVTAVFSINHELADIETIKLRGRENLAAAMSNILRLIKVVGTSAI